MRVLILLAVVVAALVLCLPDPARAFPAHLVMGWARFLRDNFRQMSVDWGGVLTAGVCLAGLTLGLHTLGRWLYRPTSPEGSATTSGPRWQPRWTVAILSVVVLMFVAGIAAIGLTHQTVWLITSPEPYFRDVSVREPIVRSEVANNLKQIGLAAANHHDMHKHFPAGGLFDRHGRGLHGWQTQLLPFIDLHNLHRQIDLNSAWNTPRNAPFFKVAVPVYSHPAAEEQQDAAGFALTHFAGNVRVLGGNVPVRLTDVKDGTTNTLLAGEAAAHFKPWGFPTNWRDPALGIHTTANGFGSPADPRGAQFVFTDCSVRFLSREVSPAVLRALSTPAGGEPIQEEELER